MSEIKDALFWPTIKKACQQAIKFYWRKMFKDLRREFGLIFLIPKNIYLPLSIFGIIFLIFFLLDFDETLTYVSSFIASFITIFIISENTFKDDYITGYIEQKLCETESLVSYLFFLIMKDKKHQLLDLRLLLST